MNFFTVLLFIFWFLNDILWRLFLFWLLNFRLLNRFLFLFLDYFFLTSCCLSWLFLLLRWRLLLCWRLRFVILRFFYFCSWWRSLNFLLLSRLSLRLLCATSPKNSFYIRIWRFARSGTFMNILQKLVSLLRFHTSYNFLRVCWYLLTCHHLN